MFDTPILYIIFNRLDTVKQTFPKIREQQPRKLFIAADGPRLEKKDEVEKCQEVRQWVLSQIDWDCDVKTLFRDDNLGCGENVSRAITWFFDNIEQGIILEDDCLPATSFFKYCEELLEYYKNDYRVFLISGHTIDIPIPQIPYSYFFSNLGGIWGWASWKRAWKYYDFNMKNLPEFIENNHFQNLFGTQLGIIRKKQLLTQYHNPIDTWDYQWGFARHMNNGLACVPIKNQIKNIGF